MQTNKCNNTTIYWKFSEIDGKRMLSSMLSVSKTEYMRVQLRGRRSGLVSDSDSHISRLFFDRETERVPYSSVSFSLL